MGKGGQSGKATLTSKAAEIILAFLLSAAPTALKFLSRISAYSSSAELSCNFLGSVGKSLLTSPCFFCANFSGGNLTYPVRQWQWYSMFKTGSRDFRRRTQSPADNNAGQKICRYITLNAFNVMSSDSRPWYLTLPQLELRSVFLCISSYGVATHGLEHCRFQTPFSH